MNSPQVSAISQKPQGPIAPCKTALLTKPFSTTARRFEKCRHGSSARRRIDGQGCALSPKPFARGTLRANSSGTADAHCRAGVRAVLRDDDCPTGVAMIGLTGILSRRYPQHFHQGQLPILDDAQSRLRPLFALRRKFDAKPRPWTNEHGTLLYGRRFEGYGDPPMPILLILILLLLLGALPTWPYSHDWGYYPSSGLGLVLVILLIVMLMGRRGRV
jgi:Protein of unknown function (DUF3309)